MLVEAGEQLIDGRCERIAESDDRAGLFAQAQLFLQLFFVGENVPPIGFPGNVEGMDAHVRQCCDKNRNSRLPLDLLLAADDALGRATD